MKKFKIINALNGFQNPYKQAPWEVWEIDGVWAQKVFCDSFRTKKQAQEHVKYCKELSHAI